MPTGTTGTTSAPRQEKTLPTDTTGTTGAPTQEKTFLSVHEVLECLSYDLVVMLEHSIFLRPTKFASLFIVRHILNSRSKE